IVSASSDVFNGAPADVGIPVSAVAEARAVQTHALKPARVAMMHTWLNTQDEGWWRIAFDQYQIPYAYISTQDVAREANLKAKYDVIVFAPAARDSAMVVNGLPMYGNPLPWKTTPLTPNLGKLDSTDDMRPGLGYTGLMNLQKFVQGGGVFITVDDT